MYSTAGAFIVISCPQPGLEGCSNSSENQVWLDTTQPDGKSMYATVLAAYLSGHTLGLVSPDATAPGSIRWCIAWMWRRGHEKDDLALGKGLFGKRGCRKGREWTRHLRGDCRSAARHWLDLTTDPKRGAWAMLLAKMASQ
jgi:hypothetical protein